MADEFDVRDDVDEEELPTEDLDEEEDDDLELPEDDDDLAEDEDELNPKSLGAQGFGIEEDNDPDTI